MFAAHVLGPHLLTSLLPPALTDSSPTTVIRVSSGGQCGQKLVLYDVQYRHGRYRPAVGYARTKHMKAPSPGNVPSGCAHAGSPSAYTRCIPVGGGSARQAI